MPPSARTVQTGLKKSRARASLPAAGQPVPFHIPIEVHKLPLLVSMTHGITESRPDYCDFLLIWKEKGRGITKSADLSKGLYFTKKVIA